MPDHSRLGRSGIEMMGNLRAGVEWIVDFFFDHLPGYSDIQSWSFPTWLRDEYPTDDFPFAYYRRGADPSMRCLITAGNIDDPLHKACPPGPCGCSCHFFSERKISAQFEAERAAREPHNCGLCGELPGHNDPRLHAGPEIYDPVTGLDARSWWPNEAEPRRPKARRHELELVGAPA